jgi:hypothetical protein
VRCGTAFGAIQVAAFKGEVSEDGVVQALEQVDSRERARLMNPKLS